MAKRIVKKNNVGKVNNNLMLKNSLQRTVSDAVNSFVVDIIDGAMKEFDVDFIVVYNALCELGYWELLNDDDIAVVGMHYGENDVLEKIKEHIDK